MRVWGWVGGLAVLAVCAASTWPSVYMFLPMRRVDVSAGIAPAMKAVRFATYGGPEVLTVQEVPLPKIAAHEVLIRVHAAAINPVDWKILAGFFGFVRGILFEDFPSGAGFDASGVVVAVGSAVTKHRVGDEVYTFGHFSRMGALAQYFAVLEEFVAAKSPALSYVQAASLPMVFVTGYEALLARGHMQPGARVLVLGGSGGTGAIGVQLAKASGASWVGATTSARNTEFVRSLGADLVIDYTQTNFSSALSRFPKVHIVYDTVGGATHWEEAKQVLVAGGTYVTIVGDNGGDKKSFTSLVATGFTLFERKFLSGYNYVQFTAMPNYNILDACTTLVNEAKLRPVIDSVHCLTTEGVREAYAILMRGHAVGKVVVDVGCTA